MAKKMRPALPGMALAGCGACWGLMNKFNAGTLVYCAAKFAMYQRVFLNAANAVVSPSAPVFTNLLSHLQKASNAFKSSGIPAGAKRLTSIHTHLTASGPHVSGALAVEARIARETIITELKVRKFLRIADDRKGYLDQADLFGASVTTAFPSASGDITEAGNCLAAECGTAAVFHLMRAAEISLRALAVDRGVTYPNATVESKQVGDLLMALDAKVKKLRETDAKFWPSVEVRDAQVKFYGEAMVQFRGFNEAWRKHMAHAHEGAFYERDVANGIMSHVGA